MKHNNIQNKFIFEQLEPRLLLSADLDPISLAGALPHENIETVSTVVESQQVSDIYGNNAGSAAAQFNSEIFFVDASIQDYELLIDDLLASASGNRQVEVITLNSDSNGIEKISAILSQRQDIDAVHIVSHGSDGAVKLGTSWLTAANIGMYSDAIAGWQNALSDEADLLFYGCDLAAGENGLALVNNLASITGADVAASDNLTGSAEIGGDWDLEYAIGNITARTGFSNGLRENWTGTLDIISGTVFTDEGVTPVADGTTISLLANGSFVGSADVSGGAGDYSIDTGATDLLAGDALLLYIDDEASQGNTVTVTKGDNLDNIDIYVDHVNLRHDDGEDLTNAMIGTARGAYVDGDILFSVTGNNLTVTDATTELYLMKKEPYAPGGNITTPSFETLDNFDGGTFTIDVNGDLTITDGTFTATSGTLTVSGDFNSKDHAFTHNSGTVILDGSGQSVLGNIHFYNLIKSVSTADTITFESGKHIRIDSGGTLVLEGGSGQRLTIESSISGNSWDLQVQDPPAATINYVNIADTDASGSDTIPVYITNAIDSGGNTDLDIPINNIPDANEDSASTNVNIPVIINVIGNDTDFENNTLSVLDYTFPANGSIVDNGNGTITYIPNITYTGADSFDYLIIDDQNSAGLNAHWRLDNNALDIDVIGGSIGTVIGPNTVGGVYGNALAFDQVNDYVEIPDDASYYQGSSWSVSFRFKIDDITGTAFQYMYSHGTVSTQNSLNISIGEASNPDIDMRGMLVTNVRDDNDGDSPDKLNVDINALIGDGLWHTYTLVVNSDGSEVFLDGVSQISDGRGNDAFDPVGNIFLGARNDLDLNQFFGGALDSLQIYDNALRASEVTLLHAGTSPSQASVTIQVGGVPVISGLDGDSLAYAEGAGAMIIDQGKAATVIDGDSANFDTGNLTVNITAGGIDGEDVLSIQNQGSASGEIGFDGVNVTYGVTQIGTAAGGTNGAPLVITFNANATPAVASALLNNISFENTEVDFPTVGSRTVRFTINDGDGNTSAASDTIVTVSSANDPPTATNLTQNILYGEDPGANVAIDDIVVSDVDTIPVQTITATLTLADINTGVLTAASGNGETYDALTGVWTVTGTLAQVNLALAAVEFVPALNNDVDTTISTLIRDQDNTGPAIGTITLDVTPENDPPVLDAIGNKSVDEGTLLSFTATASDVDLPANTLSFSLAGSVPAGASITGGGDFTWTPTEVQGPGVYTFDVVVTDDGTGTLSDSETISVTVNEVNTAPVLDAIGNKSVDEGTLLSFTATASDVDLPANTLSFSLAGSVPAGASITGGGDFTWTPTEVQGPGVYTFDVVVTDDGTGTLSDSETISVTVNEVNTAPVLDAIGNKSVDEGTLLSFTATASDVDLPANTLSFSLAGSVPAGASITGGGDFTWTPTEVQGPGVYTFDVVVTDDGTGTLSDSETISVTVNEVNTAPVLDAIGNKSVDEGTLLSFTATASDVDLPANTLSFSLAGSVPAGASITGGGDFTWTPTEVQGPGVYTFDVVVTDDGTGTLSDSETISVTVNEVNTAPVLDAIGNKSVDEGTLLSFTATASDVDLPANTLSFSLAGSVPAGASITGGGDFTWTPTEVQGPGVYTFDVVVTDDGTGTLSDSETISVTVNEVNTAPVLDAIGNKSVDEGTLLSFTATASDVDLPANTLSFSLAGSVPAGASITGGGDFTWTPTEVQGPGVYTFDVVVTDDGTGTLSDSETISVTVNEVNTAPVLDAIGNKSVDEGTLLSFTATASDVDLPANTLSFSLAGSVPAGASITGGGDFTWTPTEVQGPGVYTFDVVVTDDGTGTLSDSETISVTVNEVNTAPVLDAIGNKSVDEGTLLSFTATASDVDLPANTLSFSLAGSVPAGASITGGGDFTWTPTEVQGPGVYTFDVVVTDDGTGTLSDSETISVTVNEVNTAPVLDAIGNKSVDEGTLLSFTATASDVDLPANTLSFSLAGSVPAGASITGGGDFTWTPTEVQGPGVYTFDVVVTDDGTGTLSDSETISVTVNEVNVPPTLAGSIPDKTAFVDTFFSFTFDSKIFNDADIPVNTLTYSASLASGAVLPAWISFDPITRTFSGSPVNDDVGTITVVVTADDSGLDGTISDQFDITISEKLLNSAEITDKTPATSLESGTGDTVVAESVKAGEDSNNQPDVEESDYIADDSSGPQNERDFNEKATEKQQAAATTPLKALLNSPGVTVNPTEFASFNLEYFSENFTSGQSSINSRLSGSSLASKSSLRQKIDWGVDYKITSRLLQNTFNDIEQEAARKIKLEKTVIGSAIAATTSLSVGYVVWLIRSGMLLSTLLSSLPAWQITDPLPILTKLQEDEVQDDESLEQIIGDDNTETETDKKKDPERKGRIHPEKY